MLRPAQRFTLFPYTTLFRSLELQDLLGGSVQAHDFLVSEPEALHELDVAQGFRRRAGECCRLRDNHLLNCLDAAAQDPRSEEHTSELQSQSNLVCRLLLEKN